MSLHPALLKGLPVCSTVFTAQQECREEESINSGNVWFCLSLFTLREVKFEIRGFQLKGMELYVTFWKLSCDTGHKEVILPCEGRTCSNMASGMKKLLPAPSVITNQHLKSEAMLWPVVGG